MPPWWSKGLFLFIHHPITFENCLKQKLRCSWKSLMFVWRQGLDWFWSSFRHFICQSSKLRLSTVFLHFHRKWNWGIKCTSFKTSCFITDMFFYLWTCTTTVLIMRWMSSKNVFCMMKSRLRYPCFIIRLLLLKLVNSISQ